VVAYPTDRPASYAASERLARQALAPHRPLVLLGESFSGPIAVSIAARPPAGLAGLVLSTTFARNPVPILAPLAALAPLAPVRGLPRSALSWYLLGRWATPELEAQLAQALSQVAPEVLRKRAANALRVDVSADLASIVVPTLYLRASHDRLMHRSAGDLIMARIADARRVDLAGPHLLLQTAPAASALAIGRWWQALA